MPQKLMYDIPVRYIRSYWDLGMFITFDPARIRRNMELGYLDTMKTLGLLDGFAYSCLLYTSHAKKFLRRKFFRRNERKNPAPAQTDSQTIGE